MQLNTIPAALIAALMLASCGGANENAASNDPAAAPEGAETVYTIDADATELLWKGTMLGVKHHDGRIRMTDGKLVLKGGQLTTGKFVVDMNTITPMDDNYAPDGSEQGTRSMLVGHLMSDDFFDVTNHPTAYLVIDEVRGNQASAKLTVRGVTDTETITDIQVTEANGKMTATGKLTFDRQKYGVAMSSGIKDAVLSDKIELTVNLVAAAQ